MTALHLMKPNCSVISVLCRICYDSEKDEDLITPCNCKGTVAFVHRSCLETWLGESNTTKCELCHQVFKTERTPKYSSWLSIWYWCRYSPGTFSHGVRSDILACTIITPLAILITYVCLFSSEYYSQKKFINVPAARWTSVSLLIMVGIMLIGYYIWVYSVVRMHARLWYNWWQRTCHVRYIEPSSVCISIPGTEDLNHAHQMASPSMIVIGMDNNFSESNNTIISSEEIISQKNTNIRSDSFEIVNERLSGAGSKESSRILSEAAYSTGNKLSTAMLGNEGAGSINKISSKIVNEAGSSAANTDCLNIGNKGTSRDVKRVSSKTPTEGTSNDGNKSSSKTEIEGESSNGNKDSSKIPNEGENST